LAIKQIEYEKSQSLMSEADRAFELIGRAIHMAGYRNIQAAQIPIQNSGQKIRHQSNHISFIEVEKKSGFRGSDSLTIRHELSNGVDFDCIGNVLTKDRTKNHLAIQGFLVDRQAGIAKGTKVNGGSLICQSLDRQGRIQNTTLMNGVNSLLIEDLSPSQAQQSSASKLFKIKLQMTDGAKLNLDLERTFATRNLL
jgi:hypothetical protein